MKCKVDTSTYTKAHGAAPKGYGRWTFLIPAVHQLVTFAGGYREARRSAVAVTNALGLSRVNLCA